MNYSLIIGYLQFFKTRNVYIKCELSTEPYVYIIYNERIRSLLSILRAGCLDLEIEIGRWRDMKKDDRICKLCSDGIKKMTFILCSIARNLIMFVNIYIYSVIIYIQDSL